MSYNKTLWIDDETIITAERMNKIEDCLEKNVSDFNTHVHTKAEIVDFPKSMPANGGNADTVNNKKVNDDAKDDMSLWTASKVSAELNNLSSELNNLESSINTKLEGKADVHNHPFAPSMHSHIRSEILDFEHTHTVGSITDFPTSLPANGGNADTVDGKHFNEFVQMPPSRLSISDLNNANYPYAYRTSIASGSDIGLPTSSWYHIDYFKHLDNNGFGFQMAYPLNHNGAICARWSNGTSWQAWRTIYSSVNKPTAADIGAAAASHTHTNYAPSGYGLGGSCTNISGGDWNNALKIGFYMGSGCANAPNTDWWMGYVLNHHDGWIIQKVCNFNSSQQWMVRYKLNGSWTAWSNEYTRKTVVSPGSPSGGVNGDVWLKYS